MGVFMAPQAGVPDWYVLTGVPSSGKTTLAASLQALGYHIVPDAARAVIDEAVRNGVSARELRADRERFNHSVLRRRLLGEEEAPRDRIVFHDGGVPCNMAFFRLCGLDTGVVEGCARGRYKKVFLMERLPKFEQDYARTESEDDIEKLDRYFHSVYADLGYEVIPVPAMPVEDRVRLVLSHI